VLLAIGLVVGAIVVVHFLMALLAPLVTFVNVMGGLLGAMGLLAGVASLCRCVLKHRNVSFKWALLSPPIAVAFLLIFKGMYYFATEDYKLTYVGTGMQPGDVFSFLAFVFLVFSFASLAFGVASAMGLPDDSGDNSKDKQHFVSLGI
jgi:hypothetical protein